jgi:para-nitrobenzyl esterase
MKSFIVVLTIAIAAAAFFAGVTTGVIDAPWRAKEAPAPLTAPGFSVDPEKAAVDVESASGVLIGYLEDGVRIFKGVPYAAAPVGDLRWRAPAKAPAWEGTRSAQSFGYDCLQNRASWDPSLSLMEMSEDCLTLNVWTASDNAAPAPVMVWIHGGGFVMGSASQDIFDGAALAKKGAVIVTFNYRLGRFGFFAHPDLTKEAAGGPTGNFGLMDQIAALRWVRENISAFGGDPDNVTIFGESGGGASVAHLMAIGEASGLFHKAIIQSGGGRLKWAPIQKHGADEGAEAAGVAYSKSLKGSGDSLAQLRSLPAQTILGEVSFSKLRSKTYSGPMIDGGLVKREFLQSFADGVESKTPMIVGANSAELNHMPGIAKFLIRRGVKKALKPQLKDIENAYGGKRDLNKNIINDWGFVEPARTLARRHETNGAPAWLYEFDYVHAALRDKFEGARHASDMAFVFGTVGKDGVAATDEDRRASDQIAAYWVAFARDGTPAPAGLPEWPQYDAAADERMTFASTGPAMKTVRNAAALDLIASASDGEGK